MAKNKKKRFVEEEVVESNSNGLRISSGRIARDKAVGLVSLALPVKDYGDATSGIMLSVEDSAKDELVLTSNSLEMFIKTKIKLQEKGDAVVS